MQVGIAAAVLEVDADSAGPHHRGDGALQGRRVVAVAPLDVGSEGYRDDPGDLGEGGDQAVGGQIVAVGIAVRPGHGRARGGHRLGARVLHQGRAGGVPGVGKHEDPRTAVQFVEVLRPFCLFGHGPALEQTD